MPMIMDTKEYLDTLCELLQAGQEQVSFPVAGTSMCPFLHPEDTVFLENVGQILKPGMIYLFVRPTGQYVLHRLIRVEEGGMLWMLGDNQTVPEPVAGRHMLRGQVTAVRRKGRICTPGSPVWQFYAKAWRRLRGPIIAVRAKLRRQ